MVLIISRQPEVRKHMKIQPNLCDYLPPRNPSFSGPLPAVSFLGCRSLTNQLHGLNQSSTLLKLQYVRVSKNRGVYPPKSSILIGFGTIINHPFWGFSPYFWVDTHVSSTKNTKEHNSVNVLSGSFVSGYPPGN